jgi:hypothetical protein|nr:MAG TPA: hypothetical protein [Bacteriophage sp.]
MIMDNIMVGIYQESSNYRDLFIFLFLNVNIILLIMIS